MLRRVGEIASTTKIEEEKMKKKIFTLQKEKKELQKKNGILINVDTITKDRKRSVSLISSIRTPDFLDLQYSTSITSSEDSWGDISSASSELLTDYGCASIRFPEREALKSESNHQSEKITRHSNVSKMSFPSMHVGIQFSSVLTKESFKDEEDLLVYGFMGFNGTLNRRPTFGSRLVGVDEISLERGKWKMEDLVDYICLKNGSIQMRFCNEPLATAQIEQLVATVNDVFHVHRQYASPVNEKEALKSESNYQSEKITRHSNVSEMLFPSKHVGIQFSSVLTKGNFKDKEDLLVCGFMGFDGTLNRQPAFGSRLVGVDEISLEREKWKMEDLVNYICLKNGSVQMRFCNEPLTAAQI